MDSIKEQEIGSVLQRAFTSDQRHPRKLIKAWKTVEICVRDIRAVALLLLLMSFTLSGCGTGGYIGGGITSLSRAQATIDAAQSISITANVTAGLPVTWKMNGPVCSGEGVGACGSLSAATGNTITYTAPSAVVAPMQVLLTASVAGTSSSSISTITVDPAPKLTGNPPSGVVGVAYSTTITASGGTAPLKLSQSGGTLPPGLAFNSTTGVISGTPTTVGTYVSVFSLTDSSDIPETITAQETIAVVAQGAAALTIGGNPPSGTVGAAYMSQLSVSGGIAPYTWSVASGALPAGLTLSPSTGLISGIPTTQGTFGFAASVQDASGTRVSASFVIAIAASGNGSGLTLTTATLPSGTVGVPYASLIGLSGGVAPYQCTASGGALPAGLTLNSNCTVTGTPTAAGTATLTVKATDSASPANSITGPEGITINPAPATLTLSAPPNGTAGTPYTGAIGVSGGTAPYTCALVSGTLPVGLSLNANCSLSGTPTTAGTSTVVVKATDSASPANTNSGSVPITISAAAAALTLSSPPNGTLGSPYVGSVGVTGGTAPYSCVLAGGSLPAGLTLNSNCSLSGTPTTAGTSTVQVKATDAASPANTTTMPVSITILAAPVTLTVTSPPNGTVGTIYTGSIPVSGGTGPYTCSLQGGTLPAGLTLNTNCSLSGTPTAAGTSTVSVKAIDSSSPANNTTGNVPITISAAPAVLTLSSPPNGTVGTPYTGSIPVTGGTAPYMCVLAGGTLPTGLTLNANCSLSGTPTMAGMSTVSVTATDSSHPTNATTSNVPITINPTAPTLTVTPPPAGTVGTPYTGGVGVTGGTAPYTCTIAAGSLPAGLMLNANCMITGTPTTPGTTPVTITTTDSGSPTTSTSTPVTITINPMPALTLTLAGGLPNAILNQPYTQTLHAAGGTAPYTYALTAGSLPAGITLSSTGVISGTPTAVGLSSFTVTATDSEATPMTASLPLTLLVVYAPTANDGELIGPYAFLFQGYDDVVAGVLAYQTATVGSFTANGVGVVTGGEFDANHQGSAPTGATVPTRSLVGSYTIGADNRGLLAISTLNADGTAGATSIYAIAVKAPVSPATASASGNMIEADNDHLVGTRGSGTFLAQTSADFSTGVQGGFAFGLSGDTPCLPACTVGIVAGPAASVGEFAVSGSTISGSGDANIATTKIANSGLSGTIAAADGNGRVQLTMNTTGTLSGVYPTDYAVYMVNANQAFVLSTDKHSAYILLAGSAHKQAQATYSNAFLTGNYVGYENSPTNPGLAGVAVQNVLNLSTATIFRGVSNGAGTCTTTNVDQGGTTALVNGLTGLGSGSPILNGILGTYKQLGDSSCTVVASGRAVISYPTPDTILTGTLTLLGLTAAPPAPRVAYLYDQNQGYFLETGYAGLGRLEMQTGSPFTLSTLQGTYTYGTAPAASLASLNAAGIFTADGAGHASYTFDENVGVGNINLVQLGVTGNATYTLTDAAAGRFLLGSSTVIYAISPNRFVLLDTSALSTSPSVALIQ